MSDLERLWWHEDPVKDLGIDVPVFIEQDISGATVAAIIKGMQEGHGGCASGAYMPAVTYHSALATLSEHGNAVWDFLEERDALAVPDIDSRHMLSWANLACYFLSTAVETWAQSVAGQIADQLAEREDDEEETP